MERLPGEGKAHAHSLDGEARGGREHLTDGAGVRAASRLTGVHKTTILSLILKLGAGCEWLHNCFVRGLSINRIECDEMHTFIHTREHNLHGDEPGEWGTSWLWLAVASTAKIISVSASIAAPVTATVYGSGGGSGDGRGSESGSGGHDGPPPFAVNAPRTEL